MSTKTGSQFFAEAMKGYGVTHAFFVPTMLMSALAAMDDLGIVPVMTHGEKAAAYMADGYARVSRRPGLCLAQTVGASNLAAGLKDAFMACSPVIAVTGGPRRGMRHRHVYQEVEDFRLFDAVTKLNLHLEVADQLPDVIRQLFRSATAGKPQPVHLELAGHYGDILEPEANLEITVEERFTSVPAFRPSPEPDQIEAAVRALADAERPVIVAGGGVAVSGAGPEIVALAEKLSIPVVTSLNGKGSIPENHRLAVGVIGVYSRVCANRVVAESDLVFFVGSQTGSQVTNNWKIPRPGTPVMQLDIDPEELGRAYPNKVSLWGDAKVALGQMVAAAPSKSRSDWLARVDALVSEWRTETEPFATSDAEPIRPERICREINAVLPDEAIVVSDTGHSGMWTGQNIEITKPGQRFIRCAGSLGWGFPAAIGAKCAAPNTPVICFTGDGGLYYHIAELETAARYGINVVVVVNNNHSLNQEIPHVNEAYSGNPRGHSSKIWTFEPINFAEVAQTMGCLGLRVERPDELRGVLKRALSANQPAVVDVVSDINALAPRAWG